MLVLTSRVGDSVVIDVPAGEARRIEVEVLKLTPGRVRLGIEAARDVGILRGELIDAKEPTAAA